MDKQSTGNTGTGDETFNLVSILYHSLQSAETIDRYTADGAQNGGGLEQFFQETKKQNKICADRAKQLLAQQLGQSRSAEAGG